MVRWIHVGSVYMESSGLADVGFLICTTVHVFGISVRFVMRLCSCRFGYNLVSSHL